MENFITRDMYGYMPEDQAMAMRRSAAIRRAREKRKNDLERARIAAQLKIAEMEQKPAVMRSRAALRQAATGERELGLRYGPGGTERERAGAAMLEAQAGAAREKARYGPGGLEERNLGLTREELQRRFPYGLPKYSAKTARMNALAAQRRASATETWAGAQAKRNLGELAIEQANQVPSPTVAAPNEEAIVNEVSKKLKKKKPLVEEPANTTTEEPGGLTGWLERLLGY